MANDEFVEGLDALFENLDRVGERFKGKYLMNALAAGGRQIRDAAKTRIPVGDRVHKSYKGLYQAPGTAKNSIVVARFKPKDDGGGMVSIGVKRRAFYAVNFIELGWRSGGRSKAVKKASRTTPGGLSASRLNSLGDKRKTVQAKPWLLPAYKAAKTQAQTAFSKSLKRAVDRAIKKAK